MAENANASGNALTNYLRESRGEVRKVTWPTRDEALRWTGIVLLVTLLMTIVLSSADYVFSQGLSFLVDTYLGVGG